MNRQTKFTRKKRHNTQALKSVDIHQNGILRESLEESQSLKQKLSWICPQFFGCLEWGDGDLIAFKFVTLKLQNLHNMDLIQLQTTNNNRKIHNL